LVNALRSHVISAMALNRINLGMCACGTETGIDKWPRRLTLVEVEPDPHSVRLIILMRGIQPVTSAKKRNVSIPSGWSKLDFCWEKSPIRESFHLRRGCVAWFWMSDRSLRSPTFSVDGISHIRSYLSLGPWCLRDSCARGAGRTRRPSVEHHSIDIRKMEVLRVNKKKEHGMSIPIAVQSQEGLEE